MFSRLAVISPSVWYDDKKIVSYVKALTKRPRLRIWLDTGTKEGGTTRESEETVANARLLLETLILKGWKPGRDLIYFEKDDAEHNEHAWAARVGPMLRFLFPSK